MAFSPSVALDYLRRAHAGGRLGHAYLLIGGEEAFALAKAVAGLVAHANPASILANRDVYVVEPESKSRRIVVEQMRELENSLRLRASTDGGRKVGIVREADRLQVQASNAFLKTLEEPPAESLLLLVTALPESLPETILSRCIKVVLREDGGSKRTVAPEEAAVLDLLARYAHTRPADGAPSVAAGYLFLRGFTQLLAAARARVLAEGEAAFKREQAQYGQTTDGSWLSEREAYHKGLAEARYVAERGRLVEALGGWWRDVLRQQTAPGDGRKAPDAPNHGTAELVGRLATADILQRLSWIEELRENLDRNIQEALALEVAFLQVFGS